MKKSEFYEGMSNPWRNPSGGTILPGKTFLDAARTTKSGEEASKSRTSISTAEDTAEVHGQLSEELPDTWISKNILEVGRYAGISTEEGKEVNTKSIESASDRSNLRQIIIDGEHTPGRSSGRYEGRGRRDSQRRASSGRNIGCGRRYSKPSPSRRTTEAEFSIRRQRNTFGSGRVGSRSGRESRGRGYLSRRTGKSATRAEKVHEEKERARTMAKMGKKNEGGVKDGKKKQAAHKISSSIVKKNEGRTRRISAWEGRR